LAQSVPRNEPDARGRPIPDQRPPPNHVGRHARVAAGGRIVAAQGDTIGAYRGHALDELARAVAWVRREHDVARPWTGLNDEDSVARQERRRHGAAADFHDVEPPGNEEGG
jgi:hypothetical protein